MKLLWQLSCLGCVAAFGLMAQPGPPPGPPMHGNMWFGPGARIMPFDTGSGGTITGAPYSALQTTEMVQKLGDGNTIVEKTQSNVYRDTQGRVRIEHSFPARPGSNTQTPRKMVSIFDPVAGSSYVLQPDQNTAFKSAMRQRPPADSNAQGAQPRSPRHHGAPPTAAQATSENLGIQTINGVAATGTRTTQIIPAGAIGNTQPIQIVREVWMAQDLKIPVMIKTSDPRFGETTMQLTNVSQANPDPALFQVPANFTIQTSPGRPSGGHMRPPANGATR
jgi:hypothetical protein